MKHTPVSSSHIDSVGYDDDASALHVKFKNGDTWAYTGKSAKAHHDAMLRASSPGSYFHANVKGNSDLSGSRV